MIMMFAADEGIDLEYHSIDLAKGEHRQPDYKAINPSCLVPTLDDDGFRLTESGAILRYLANKTGSSAYPSELRARARVDELMEWFYSNYYKDHGYGMVYPQLFPHHQRPDAATQAGTIAWGKSKAEHWLAILDQDLIGPERQYLCGGEVTLADYAGAEMVLLGELVHCKYEKYSNVRRWLGNMKRREHWGDVHEVFAGFAASLKDKHFVSI